MVREPRERAARRSFHRTGPIDPDHALPPSGLHDRPAGCEIYFDNVNADPAPIDHALQASAPRPLSAARPPLRQPAVPLRARRTRRLGDHHRTGTRTQTRRDGDPTRRWPSPVSGAADPSRLGRRRRRIKLRDRVWAAKCRGGQPEPRYAWPAKSESSRRGRRCDKRPSPGGPGRMDPRALWTDRRCVLGRRIMESAGVSATGPFRG